MLKKEWGIVLGAILFFCMAVLLFEVGAVNEYDEAKNTTLNASKDILIEGKNYVLFEKYVNIKDLIRKNSEIETVSYYDDFSEKTVGYVNIFGGIGKEFLITPGKIYEISIRKEKKLML